MNIDHSNILFFPFTEQLQSLQQLSRIQQTAQQTHPRRCWCWWCCCGDWHRQQRRVIARPQTSGNLPAAAAAEPVLLARAAGADAVRGVGGQLQCSHQGEGGVYVCRAFHSYDFLSFSLPCSSSPFSSSCCLFGLVVTPREQKIRGSNLAFNRILSGQVILLN